MFTGIVEAIGSIKAFKRQGKGGEVSIAIPTSWELSIGDSLAVNGVCLTVTSFQPGLVTADLSSETLSRSSLSLWQPQTPVNLERPLTLQRPLGGHFVQGHVDGIGILQSIWGGETKTLALTFPDRLKRYMVEKGSIALQGISLTISHLEGNSLHVAVIPHTWKNTTLHRYQPGQPVHLEVDVLAKYTERLIRP